MKRLIGYAAMLALVCAPAFAAKNAKNSENVTLAHAVTVGTTQLPAAQYKVTWNGTGSNAQVTLTHGSSVITLPAKVVEEKSNSNSVRVEDKGGASILLGFYLRNVSVEFTPGPSSGQ